MIKTIISFVALAILAAAPLTSYATSHPQDTASPPQDRANPPSVTAGGPDGRVENPLRGADSIGELFQTLAQFVIDLAYVVIAAFLILSGFKFIKAQGKPEELAKAKATFWYTIIGAIIIIGMDTMIAVFKRILEQLGN
jgi:hypothetical protein